MLLRLNKFLVNDFLSARAMYRSLILILYNKKISSVEILRFQGH